MKVDIDELERRIRSDHNARATQAQTLALISYIRELRMGLADAMYWLKPGLEGKAVEMGEERARLSALLAKDPELT